MSVNPVPAVFWPEPGMYRRPDGSASVITRLVQAAVPAFEYFKKTNRSSPGAALETLLALELRVVLNSFVKLITQSLMVVVLVAIFEGFGIVTGSLLVAVTTI
jgi:hypothetical protein